MQYIKYISNLLETVFFLVGYKQTKSLALISEVAYFLSPRREREGWGAGAWGGLEKGIVHCLKLYCWLISPLNLKV